MPCQSYSTLSAGSVRACVRACVAIYLRRLRHTCRHGEACLINFHVTVPRSNEETHCMFSQSDGHEACFTRRNVSSYCCSKPLYNISGDLIIFQMKDTQYQYSSATNYFKKALKVKFLILYFLNSWIADFGDWHYKRNNRKKLFDTALTTLVHNNHFSSSCIRPTVLYADILFKYTYSIRVNALTSSLKESSSRE